MPFGTSSDTPDAGDARAMLHLPEKFDLPEPEAIVQDARARVPEELMGSALPTAFRVRLCMRDRRRACRRRA